MVERRGRTVVLRAEVGGGNRRYLSAYLTAAGDLFVDGQDLGPVTAAESDDGEYDWRTIVAHNHLPELAAHLAGDPDVDILDVLEQRFTGQRSYDLERILSSGPVPTQRFTYGG